MSWNLSVLDQKIVLELGIEEGGAVRAVQAAERAETARDIAIAKETNILIQEAEINITAQTVAADKLIVADDKIIVGNLKNETLDIKNQTQVLYNDTTVIKQDILDLLPNFPNPSIFALNRRIINEGATVMRKLRFVQIELDNLSIAS